MTKKDYKMIASAIRRADVLYSREAKKAHVAIEVVALNIAQVLQEESPRFDKQNSYRACGIKF